MPLEAVRDYWARNYKECSEKKGIMPVGEVEYDRRHPGGEGFHLYINGWREEMGGDRDIHYEILIRGAKPGIIEVSLYNEGLGKYDQIRTRLKEKGLEEIVIESERYHVDYNQTKPPEEENRGRVRLFIPIDTKPEDKMPELVCECMKELIDKTKDTIDEVLGIPGIEPPGVIVYPIKGETIMEKMYELLKQKKQIILQGAPGVGKTYATKELALRALGKYIAGANRAAINKEYSAAVENGQIVFTTFHQSMDYEDFIEGYKPVKSGNSVAFELKDGAFKSICDHCLKEPRTPHVLIIDEINRGNVSKIFGELITLLETDKREQEQEQQDGETLQVTLTYSQEPFTVPHNLYIIGTMNTADRSLGQIDYALRRRFAFFTLKSNKDAIEKYYDAWQDGETKAEAIDLYGKVWEFFYRGSHVNEELETDDIMIGHSYFMAKDPEDLRLKVIYEIIPLLKEYRNDGILTVEKSVFENFLKELDK